MDFETETFVVSTNSDIAHTLTGGGFDASEDGTGRGKNRANPQPGDPCHPLSSTAHPPAYATRYEVRRLMPVECEKLQGVPVGYTAIPWRGGMAADGPRYRCLGNGFAVPCIAWIGARIAMVDKL